MSLLVLLITVTGTLLGVGEPTTATQYCYCNMGVGCNLNNNTCFLEVGTSLLCQVSINTLTSQVNHFCVGQFLSCVPSFNDTITACCDTSNTCNKCLIPDNVPYDVCMNVVLHRDCPPINCSKFALPTTPTPKGGGYPSWVTAIIILLISIFTLLVILLVILLFVFYRFGKRRRLNETESIINYEKGFGLSVSSGGATGNGAKFLEKRTIANDIRKEERIGRGSFGEVWRASYLGEPVAVKLFTVNHDDSCKREYDMYAFYLRGNENIARFIAIDTKTEFDRTTVWLVLEYYANGCLSSYLKENSLTPTNVLHILNCIASGLDFLHTAINTSYDTGKPVMAHRDLKSPNILMKKDPRFCVIADFGLVVTEIDLGAACPPIKALVGTKRYLSPEILDETINVGDIMSFCKSDMYSFGLIMWEILKRALTNDHCSEYQLPYQNSLAANPTVEEVRTVVVHREERPMLENKWLNDDRLSTMCYLMQECWHVRPDVRPSARLIKKKLLAASLETKNILSS